MDKDREVRGGVLVLPLRSAVAGGAALGIVLLSASVYVARAGLVPGGPTTDGLWFSGSMTGVQKASLEFIFFRDRSAGPEERSKSICSLKTDKEVVPTAQGAFQAELPGLSACRDKGLFDGRDIYYHIKVNGQAVTDQAVPVHPVPYALYAEQSGTPECPAGYERDRSQASIVLCQKKGADGRPYDEMVKVGEGPSAFFIDRYEASVWSGPQGEEPQRGANGDDYGDGFPDSGRWSGTRPPLYALSRPGVVPGRFLTWFQAMEACAASGKELPGRQAWLRAARGTPDPKMPPKPPCNTDGSGTPGKTGERPACQSAWGAQDMIGNLWEWTDEWYASVGQWTGENMGAQKAQSRTVWPGYSEDGGDATWNVTSWVSDANGDHDGMPAAALRGGAWGYGSRAGVFALDLDNGPGGVNPDVGFRCLVRAR